MMSDFSDQRVKMVDGQIRTTDVTDATVLSAMLTVPRELFVPESRAALAYVDDNIPVSEARGENARYLMRPSPFAKLLQLADVTPRDSVLDVGTGTGYSAAVLSRLAKSVVALESDPALAERAESTLAQLGCDNVKLVRGPLPDGDAAHAPYDVIVVNGSISDLPEAFCAQLGEGGRLVAVEGAGNAGVARLYVKSNGAVTGRSAFNAAVKPLPGFERAASFQF